MCLMKVLLYDVTCLLRLPQQDQTSHDQTGVQPPVHERAEEEAEGESPVDAGIT